MIKYLLILILVFGLTSCRKLSSSMPINTLSSTATPPPAAIQPDATSTPILTKTLIPTPIPTKTLTPTKTRTQTYLPTLTLTPTMDFPALGVPATPIPNRFYKSQDHLSFNQEEYYQYQKIIHRRTVTVAWEKSLETSDEIRQAISETYFDAFITWWDIFGGFPFESYTVVHRSDPNFINVGEGGLGFALFGGEWIDWYLASSSDGFKQFYEFVGHAVFHAWNRDALVIASNDEYWLREGVTTYYGHRYAGAKAYKMWMQENLGFYKNEIKDTTCDVSLVEMGRKREFQSGCRHAYYIYKKGALVSYLIDKRLTDIGKSLDDLMRYLYIEFEFGKKPISNEDIKVALSEISGEDWTEFFENYIYGTAPLSINNQLEFLDRIIE